MFEQGFPACSVDAHHGEGEGVILTIRSTGDLEAIYPWMEIGDEINSVFMMSESGQRAREVGNMAAL